MKKPLKLYSLFLLISILTLILISLNYPAFSHTNFFIHTFTPSLLHHLPDHEIPQPLPFSNYTEQNRPITFIPLDLDALSTRPTPNLFTKNPSILLSTSFYDTRPLLFGRNPSLITTGLIQWAPTLNQTAWWTVKDALVCMIGYRQKNIRYKEATDETINEKEKDIIEESFEIIYQVPMRLEILPDHHAKEYAPSFFHCPIGMKEHISLFQEKRNYYMTLLPNWQKWQEQVPKENFDFEERWIPVELMPQHPLPPIASGKEEGLNMIEYMTPFLQNQTEKTSFRICTAPLRGDLYAPSLKSWIEFQRLMGVSDIFIYNLTIPQDSLTSQIMQGYQNEQILTERAWVLPSLKQISEWQQLKREMNHHNIDYDNLEKFKFIGASQAKLKVYQKAVQWKSESKLQTKRWLWAYGNSVLRIRSNWGWFYQAHSTLRISEFEYYDSLISTSFYSSVDLSKRKVLRMELPGNFGNVAERLPQFEYLDVHYFGQTVSIQDCLLRSVGKFRWISVMDFDEFIVPRTDSDNNELMNWQELIGNVYQSKDGEFLMSGLGFANEFQCADCKSFGFPSDHLKIQKPTFNHSTPNENDVPRFTEYPDCKNPLSLLAASNSRKHENIKYQNFLKAQAEKCFQLTQQPTEPLLKLPDNVMNQTQCFYFPSSNRTMQIQQLPYLLTSTIRENHVYPPLQRSKYIIDPIWTYIMRIHFPYDSMMRIYGSRDEECRRAFWKMKFIQEHRQESYFRIISSLRKDQNIFQNATEIEWLKNEPFWQFLESGITRPLKFAKLHDQLLPERAQRAYKQFLMLFNGCLIQQSFRNETLLYRKQTGFSQLKVQNVFVDSKQGGLLHYRAPPEMTQYLNTKLSDSNKTLAVREFYLRSCKKCEYGDAVEDYSFINKFGLPLLQRLTQVCH